MPKFRPLPKRFSKAAQLEAQIRDEPEKTPETKLAPAAVRSWDDMSACRSVRNLKPVLQEGPTWSDESSEKKPVKKGLRSSEKKVVKEERPKKPVKEDSWLRQASFAASQRLIKSEKNLANLLQPSERRWSK